MVCKNDVGEKDVGIMGQTENAYLKTVVLPLPHEPYIFFTPCVLPCLPSVTTRDPA